MGSIPSSKIVTGLSRSADRGNIPESLRQIATNQPTRKAARTLGRIAEVCPGLRKHSLNQGYAPPRFSPSDFLAERMAICVVNTVLLQTQCSLSSEVHCWTDGQSVRVALRYGFLLWASYSVFSLLRSLQSPTVIILLELGNVVLREFLFASGHVRKLMP
jgi:hypothetical protein